MISEARIRNYQRNLAKRYHPVDADEEEALRERWKKTNLAIAELRARQGLSNVHQLNRAFNWQPPVIETNDEPGQDMWRECNQIITELRIQEGRYDGKLEQLPYKEGPKVTMASSTPFIWKKLEKARQQLLARQEELTFEAIKMQLSKNFYAAESSEVAAALNLLKLDDPEDCASFGAPM